MRNALRLVLAASVLSSASLALYACSSKEEATTSGADGGSEAAADAGTDSTATDGAAADTGSAACALFDDASSPGPKLAPKACKDCVAQKCCNLYDKCYSAAPADAGLDGSDGTKTACMLAGECSNICDETDGGGDPIIVCQAKCVAQYGQAALDDYGAAWTCYEQCSTFCP